LRASHVVVVPHDVLHLLPIVFSVGAGWVLFVYLYTVLPETREPWPVIRRGALLGAVGLAILQYLASFLFGLFSHNAAAALFGPVIVLMLFFNLFAQLILFVAAWIATARQEAVSVSDEEERVRFALGREGVGAARHGASSRRRSSDRPGATSPALRPDRPGRGSGLPVLGGGPGTKVETVRVRLAAGARFKISGWLPAWPGVG
jgi:membrane protein